MLQGMCLLAGVFAVVVLVEVVYQVVSGAAPAISKFGLGFIWNTNWAVPFNRYGAGSALFGTLVCSAMALMIATPLGVAIGLYLSMLAPRRVRQTVGPLVEMLAAVPSIVLGLWGVIVLAPYVQQHVEPFLHSVLGFLPIFGPGQTTGLSLFTAGLLLSFMVLPIVASLSRDLFLTVPRELKEGAEALGATRWEVIRGVVLPTTIPGVIAATVLGLGRALGEAIAVYSVVGFGLSIHASLFSPGVTLAARIANDIQGYQSPTQLHALYYLALILLAIGVGTSLLAQSVARRFDVGLTVGGTR
jgi:phosphate transport system permease protein